MSKQHESCRWILQILFWNGQDPWETMRNHQSQMHLTKYDNIAWARITGDVWNYWGASGYRCHGTWTDWLSHQGERWGHCVHLPLLCSKTIHSPLKITPLAGLCGCRSGVWVQHKLSWSPHSRILRAQDPVGMIRLRSLKVVATSYQKPLTLSRAE